MKLVYFCYIDNSFPMLYVLNEITRGLVLVLQDVVFSRDSVLHILIVA